MYEGYVLQTFDDRDACLGIYIVKTTHTDVAIAAVAKHDSVPLSQVKLLGGMSEQLLKTWEEARLGNGKQFPVGACINLGDWFLPPQ